MNEPTEAQIEAAALSLRNSHYRKGFHTPVLLTEEREFFIPMARAALVAAARAAEYRKAVEAK